MKFTKKEFEDLIAVTVTKNLEEHKKANDAMAERIATLERRTPSMAPPNQKQLERPADGDEDAGDGEAGTKHGKVKFPKVHIPDRKRIPEDEFSFVRMIYAMRSGDWSRAPFERKAIDVGEGMFREQRDQIFGGEERAQTLGTGSAGGYLVPTVFLPEKFVDALRAAEVVRPRCDVWGSLVGSPVKVPRQTADGAVSWITEDTDIPADSDDTYDEISLTPKIMCARTRVTNLLLRNNPILAETRVRESLAKKVALGTDIALLRGTGSAGQPTGVSNVSGINTIAIGANGGALTLALLKQMVYEPAADNAVAANPCWVMHSRTKYGLSLLLDTTNRPLLQPDPTQADGSLLLGFPVYVCNQIPINLTKGSGTNLTEIYFCADIKELVLGEWDALEIDATNVGGVNWVKWSTEVRAISLIDVALKHPVSFCTIEDSTT